MILSVARLVEKKGINYLIEAFAEASKEVKCKLVIVGSGPMRPHLGKLAVDLGVKEKVFFAGEIPHSHLPKYYCAADVFVLPSIIDRTGDRETQGVVYLEAMASKLPVIGTNTGGIPDVISSKNVGVLVPQKDSIALSKAMVKLMKDKALMKRIGEKAYKHALNRFTWKSIAKRYVDVYRGCTK